MGKAKDITGHRFGIRTVVGVAPKKVFKSGYSQHMLVMKCDCGTISIEQQCNVKSGRAKSCGCLVPAIISSEKTTHGFTRNGSVHPMYNSWASMIQRCTNKKTRQYADYGGRGIGVCRRWIKFKHFLKDMGGSWFEGATIERVDVNGGYSKKNCCWITIGEQNKNKRNSVRLTHDGVTMTLSDWIRKTGVTTLKRRLEAGIPFARAIIKKR